MDHPAWQWWREPDGLQPDCCWGAQQTTVSLRYRFTLMADLGVQIFRFELPWRAVAPEWPTGVTGNATAASPNWSGCRWQHLDGIIRLLGEVGIQPLPVVIFAPPWSTGSSNPVGMPLAMHVEHVMTALARRYRDHVHYWELWNEPDHAHFWSGTLEEYVARVLVPGSSAVRSVDGNLRVVVGGLAHADSLAALYAAHAKDAFDVFSFHCYPRRARVCEVQRTVARARAIMERYGDAKPLWLTECGLATRAPSTSSGFGGYASERKQARFVTALYRRVDVDCICFYQLADSITFDRAGHQLKQVYWGLVSRDLHHRKPSYTSYAEAAQGPLSTPG